MKTKFFFSVLMLITINLTAQQGINYKALIKDGSGNVVANQTIDVRFTVIADIGPTNVYTETHTGATTDANGIVILNIGDGTSGDVFTDIAWGNDIHSLKVEIDIEQDASFEDMGTTQFVAVPYAYIAEKAKFIDGIRLEIFAPNLVIGQDAGISIVNASENTLIGQESGKSIISATSNTFLGHRSGANSGGSGNVFIGHEAGLNETGSEKLYISNSSTSFPLLFGDFATRTLTVNNVLNVAEDATINKSLTVNEFLNVGGSTTSSAHIIQSTNPKLTLKSGSTDKYEISYESSSDNLVISEVGSGSVLEIKDGVLYLPGYSGIGRANLSIDQNGKLIKAPQNNQKFGQYDYFDVDSSNSGYTISRKSVHFQDGTILTGISALLLDNNSGTGGVANTNFVILKRTTRSPATTAFDEIYRITGNNTSTGIYNTQTDLTVETSGANTIDNNTYLYYLEIWTCTACDMREVSVLD